MTSVSPPSKIPDNTDIMDKCTATLVVSDRLPIIDRRIFRASPIGTKSLAQAAQ
jgi:acyl CoA:acetate/3-ketoacid CoA transferase